MARFGCEMARSVGMAKISLGAQNGKSDGMAKNCWNGKSASECQCNSRLEWPKCRNKCQNLEWAKCVECENAGMMPEWPKCRNAQLPNGQSAEWPPCENGFGCQNVGMAKVPEWKKCKMRNGQSVEMAKLPNRFGFKNVEIPE
ncbi:hypothetical protein Nepgr_033956 [Nepenthes gracilis]|uniref:Uncharacterized protein n=1 Tax=Nepenthes gracilis TaxID=150966 RepID=A0AAD3Y718_NEPGR|nr:hypothetical protein Nepgr_033956 [Nepenthes gracilis]